jgi:hypothetical protein
MVLDVRAADLMPVALKHGSDLRAIHLCLV